MLALGFLHTAGLMKESAMKRSETDNGKNLGRPSQTRQCHEIHLDQTIAGQLDSEHGAFGGELHLLDVA